MLPAMPVVRLAAQTVACMRRAYWESVPMVYQQRLHFYNTPITSDFSDPNHPLSIIRAIYRPGERRSPLPKLLNPRSWPLRIPGHCLRQ